MKTRIEDLINFFPNDNFAVEIFDTIGIGSDSLSDIASDEYGRSFITRDEFLDFCNRHKDKIDVNKYMAYTAYVINGMDNFAKGLPLVTNDEFQSMRKEAVKRIKDIVRKNPNTRIYFLDKVDGRIVVEDFESNDILKNERTKKISPKSKKYEKQLEDDSFLKELTSLIRVEDLKKFMPTDLVKMINKKGEQNTALTYFAGKSDEEIDEYIEEHRVELEQFSFHNVCEDVLKYRDRIDMEQFMLIAAYRSKELLGAFTSLESRKQEADSVKTMAEVYNVMVDISEILGKSSKIKIKGKIIDATAPDRELKHIPYSARDLSKDVEIFAEKVKPSNFILREDPLANEEQANITSLKGLFQKVEPGEGIITPKEKEEMRKAEPLKEYRINFRTPEYREKLLKLSEKPPIVYRGTKGKAYEGYAVYIYKDLNFAVLECFYKKNRDGAGRYSYEDASSVIVPTEMLEKVLKSKTKLENIPLQKEYSAPKPLAEGESILYTTNPQSRNRKKYIRKEEHRRPVRIPHKKNWDITMNGIVKGEINPFEAIIIKRKTRKKAKRVEKRVVRSIDDDA